MASPTTTPTTVSDVANQCWTCKPVQAYVDLSKDFVDRLDVTLHDPMLILFVSFSGLWVVTSAVKLGLQLTDKRRLVEDFIYISITGVLLGSQSSGLISFVYSTALSIMGGASSSVFSIAGGAITSGDHTGLTALAATAEQAMVTVFQASQAITREASLSKIHYYVYAVVLVVPYFLLVAAYASQVVVAIFRATMVGVFAPFLFMSFAYGWGRDMAKSGAKTLLASILVLFASTAAVALCVYGVATINLKPDELTGKAVDKFLKISNPDFLVVLFLGWAGTALLTEGTSIANSIAHTMLTNAAAGIMTAGASASALLGLKGGRMAGNVAAAMGSGAQFAQAAIGNPQAMAHHYLEKFKNINGGNSGIPNKWADKFNGDGS